MNSSDEDSTKKSGFENQYFYVVFPQKQISADW
jgi:hypothetical protein